VEAKNSTEGNVDVEGFPGHAQRNYGSQLCDICLFKRRIIARDDLEHALYIIPVDKFHEVFPKIKKDEALVYHGTEFPIGQEHQNTSSNALHQQFLITDNLHVSFELLHGQNFSIVSLHTITAALSEICFKSEERIASGFSFEVLTRCSGGEDKLYMDNIKVKLQSGNRTLHLIFPIAVSLTNTINLIYY